jgi:hypothetical protein
LFAAHRLADSVRNPADELSDITVHDAAPHISHTAHHYAARKPSDQLPDITVHETAPHNSHDAHHYAARSFLSHAASSILLHAQGESFCIFGVGDWTGGRRVSLCSEGTILLTLITLRRTQILGDQELIFFFFGTFTPPVLSVLWT